MVAFYVPIGLVTAPKPILAFTDSATSSSQGGTSRTYAVSFGSGHPTRYMIVMWAMKNASGSYSCTVGGVSTSLIMNSTLGQQIFNIWIAPLPTGSSGNVIVSGSIADITVIGVYSLTFGNPTPLTTATTPISPAPSIIVPANAVLLSGIGNFASGSMSWSGGVTQDFDSSVSGPLSSFQRLTGASDPASSSPRTLTPLNTNPFGNGLGGSVTFGP